MKTEGQKKKKKKKREKKNPSDLRKKKKNRLGFSHLTFHPISRSRTTLLYL
jgi:hypothetical protein